jgi:predicted GNAT superfamily acetyltransferase
LIAVPTNFQALKAANIEQARALRLRTRALFEAAFAAGYAVVDFLVDDGIGYYLIERAPGKEDFHRPDLPAPR